MCYNKEAELNTIFNGDMSCLRKIGKIVSKPINDLVIGNEAVKWFDKLKYLGLHFCCHKQLNIDISVTANAILSHSRFLSDIAKFSLMESYVLFILTYAIQAVSVTSTMVHKFFVCWNNV